MWRSGNGGSRALILCGTAVALIVLAGTTQGSAQDRAAASGGTAAQGRDRPSAPSPAPPGPAPLSPAAGSSAPKFLPSSALSGQNSAIAGAGVVGTALAASGLTYGVYGDATANVTNTGIGVYGVALFGVYGQTSSTSTGAAGVWGDANNGAGTIYGVGGQTNSTTSGAAGVIGKANGNTGLTFGLQGQTASNSTDAAGVRGDANGASGSVFGGYFRSASTGGTGLLGWAPAASGATFGVRGESDSTSGTGVFGYAPVGNTSDYAFGVRGRSDGPSGIGVAGVAPNGTSINNPPLGTPVGVFGYAPPATGWAFFADGNVNVIGSVDVNYGQVFIDHGSLQFFDADLLLPWTTSVPACDEGKLVLVDPPGADGQLWVCRRKANNTLEWVRIF